MVVRTYAPVGKTPVLKENLTRDHLSAMSAITLERKLYMIEQEKAFKGEDALRFPKHLMRQIEGKLLIIWDGSPIHRGGAVRDFLASGPSRRLKLEQLPCYAPELNPDEGIWKRARIRRAVNEPSTVTLGVPSELLHTANPDYRSPVEITVSDAGEVHERFNGMVDEAVPEGGEIVLKLITQTQIMRESRIGGLGISPQVPRLETLSAIMRLGGYPLEKVTIEGWEPGPIEVFEVASAIDGVAVEQPIKFGRVFLLPGGPVARLAEGLGPPELRELYDRGPAWALVTCTAKTLLEAEEEAVREIDFALAWLMARAHYSSVSLPGRQPGAHKRKWTLSRMLRKDVIVARGLSTGRRWLRAPRDIPWQPPLLLGEIADIAVLVLPPDTPIQLRESVNSWRRAAEASDLFEAVVALNDAMEFYVSNVSLPDLFTKEQKNSVRDNATAGLAGDQKQRVSDVLNSMLNAPSLMMKLRKTLEDYEVPHTESDVQVVKRVRDKRNALVHGRTREAPSEDDVRYAVAFVNRMLVYRIAGLTRGAVH